MQGKCGVPLIPPLKRSLGRQKLCFTFPKAMLLQGKTTYIYNQCKRFHIPQTHNQKPRQVLMVLK
ncbi:hypothetical protein DW985_21110 [Bacteroides ovatus]|nr:hypothetical protein DW985_21110 [Bacteroides ovatus]